MTRTLIALTLSILSACSSTLGRLPELGPDVDGPYVLGAGDTLQITVYDQPDLTGSYKISDSGVLAMPLVGMILAQGLTISGLQGRLAETLNAKAVKSPDVTVQVTQYRPFFILGEVKNPGLYPYVPNITMLTAVAIAGGFTFRASQEAVSVTRQMSGHSQESRASRASRVLPGDTIYVFERHF
jgi:polysaccharide export outer membrane protein